MMGVAARWCFELRDPLVYGAVEVFGEMDDRLSVAESGEGFPPWPCAMPGAADARAMVALPLPHDQS